MDTRN